MNVEELDLATYLSNLRLVWILSHIHDFKSLYDEYIHMYKLYFSFVTRTHTSLDFKISKSGLIPIKLHLKQIENKHSLLWTDQQSNCPWEEVQ